MQFSSCGVGIRKWNKSWDDLRLTISSLVGVLGVQKISKKKKGDEIVEEKFEIKKKFKYDKFPDTIKMNITRLETCCMYSEYQRKKKKSQWKLIQKFNERFPAFLSFHLNFHSLLPRLTKLQVLKTMVLNG